MTGGFLKTQQAADALGVSVSTLKRWVDAGELKVTRTLGGHRQIAVDEALRFARRRDLSTAALERLGSPSPESSAGMMVDDRARRDLADALKEGRARDASRLIRAAHAILGGGAALGDELIAPVMREVGHGWSVGEWDVFQEHQASQIVAVTLSELIGKATRGGDEPGPVALGSSPEGDLFTLATLLGELTLREAGYSVRNLGPNLPLKSLGRAVAVHRPRLVFLAVSHLADPIEFIEEFTHLNAIARAHGAAVVLGGRGLPREIRPRLDPSGFGESMGALADFGRRLLATTSPAGHGRGDSDATTSIN